jgi:hypothetical protein
MILVMYYRIMYVKVAHMVWIWVKVLMCVWVHERARPSMARFNSKWSLVGVIIKDLNFVGS